MNEAKKNLKKAISIQPDYPVTYVNLAHLYSLKSEIKDAVEILKLGLKNCVKNNHHILYYKLGDVYNSNKEYDSALAALQKAFELNPNYLPSLFLAVDVFIIKKNYKQAAALLSRAYKIKPRDIFILNRLAYVYIKSGNYNVAEKLLRRSIMNRPNSQAYLYFSLNYTYQGNFDRAIFFIKKSIRLARNGNEYKKILDEVKSNPGFNLIRNKEEFGNALKRKK